MLAVISKADNGYVARFERELQHPAPRGLVLLDEQ